MSPACQAQLDRERYPVVVDLIDAALDARDLTAAIELRNEARQIQRRQQFSLRGGQSPAGPHKPSLSGATPGPATVPGHSHGDRPVVGPDPTAADSPASALIGGESGCGQPLCKRCEVSHAIHGGLCEACWEKHQDLMLEDSRGELEVEL